MPLAIVAIVVVSVAFRVLPPATEVPPEPSHLPLARELAALIHLRSQPGTSLSARQLLAHAARLIDDHATSSPVDGISTDAALDPRMLAQARTALAAEPALRRSLDDLLAQVGLPLTQSLLVPAAD